MFEQILKGFKVCSYQLKSALTELEFDLAVSTLRSAIQKSKLFKMAQLKQAIKEIQQHRDIFCKDDSEGSKRGDQTLFDRIGSFNGLTKIVEQVFKQVQSD